MNRNKLIIISILFTLLFIFGSRFIETRLFDVIDQMVFNVNNSQLSNSVIDSANQNTQFIDKYAIIPQSYFYLFILGFSLFTVYRKEDTPNLDKALKVSTYGILLGIVLNVLFSIVMIIILFTDIPIVNEITFLMILNEIKLVFFFILLLIAFQFIKPKTKAA